MRQALTLLLLCTPLLALAQTVWRCGADGRSYSDRPCEDGRPLATLNERPATDVRMALERAQRDQKQAQQLVAERVARETVAPIPQRRPATHPHHVDGPAPAAESAQATPAPRKPRKLKPKPSEARDTFRATAPASRPTKG